MEIKCSYHQERIWFIDEFEAYNLYDAEPVYHNIPIVFRIEGALDIDALQKALRDLVGRNEILRTKVRGVQGEPFQQVETVYDIPLERCSAEGQSLLDDGAIWEWLSAYIERPFRLAEDLLIRATLFVLRPDLHLLLITTHHIVIDKPSFAILANQLFRSYSAAMTGKADPDTEQGARFADFAQWQRNFSKDILDYHLFYWRKKFRDLAEPLQLPNVRRDAIHRYKENKIFFRFPKELSASLAGQGSSDAASRFIFLFSIWKILLFKYSGQNDITVGISVSNRDQEHTAGTIGPLANLIPVRDILDGKETFDKLSASIGKSLSDAWKYRNMPFDRLVVELDPEKDMSRTALFDILFQYEDSSAILPQTDELKLSYIELNSGWGKYDLDLLVQYQDGVFSGVITYNELYYKREFIARMPGHLMTLAQNALIRQDSPINELSLIGEEERTWLATVGRTPGTLPGGETITSLFRAQAAETPDRIAVSCEGRQLSYRELDERSDRLGNYLRQRLAGARRETRLTGTPPGLIGIRMERSEWMLLGILGILKAGAGYVPVDPSYPRDRQEYMLRDSGALCLLTDAVTETEICPVIDILQDWAAIDACEIATGATSIPHSDPGDIAYIIYTSGSTGRPKGCMVTHRNLLNLLKNSNDLFGFNEADVWLVAHSFCFDFSVWEMYGALLYGGRAVVATSGVVRDIDRLSQLLRTERITVLSQTPEAFYLLQEQERLSGKKGLEEHLRYIIFGGDKLKYRQLRDWEQLYGLEPIRLVNMYGITETTVHTTWHFVSREDIYEKGERSVIGQPLPGVSITIRDEGGHLTPIGVAGELYVGGEGVCLGYLNQEELTRQRFVAGAAGEGLVYRSGDIGLWREDGRLEYVGRKDRQTKLRGHRIELGEIEQVMLSFEGVEQAVADVRGQGTEQYITGYYISKERTEEAALLRHTGLFLPHYMVPSYMVRLEEMPLTKNGKLDRGRLPDPVQLGKGGEPEYEGPRNELERQLSAVWEKVLGRTNISIKDNFFFIGGHSLRATQLIYTVAQELQVRLDLKDIFQHPTLEGLAGVIGAHRQMNFQQIPLAAEQAFYPLSHAQRRLWIIHQLEDKKSLYNVSAGYMLRGQLNRAALERSFDAVIDRHESLRTVFVPDNGDVWQKIVSREAIGYRMEYVDLGKAADAEEMLRQLAEAEAVKVFDMATGPLIRTTLVSLSEEVSVFLLTLHHIISDGWSMEILMREIMSLYGEYTNGAPASLKPLPVQYKDYAVWQNRQLQSETAETQREYWKTQLGGELPILQLPADYRRPESKRNNGAVLTTVLGPELHAGMQEICRVKGVSLFMVLLSTVKVLLHRYTGQEDIIVGTPIAGREHAELENQIGFFVNTLALRTSVHGDESFDILLDKVRATSLGAYDHQGYPFDLLVEELGVQRDMSRMPVFDVVVALLNIDLPGDGPGSLQKLETGVYGTAATVSKFDLSFHFQETDEGMILRLEYSTDLFSEARMHRLLLHYMQIAEAAIKEGSVPVGKLSYIGKEEYSQLTTAFNDTRQPYPENSTVIELFEQQVSQTPDSIALVVGERTLTYRELSDRSSRVARYLRSRYSIRPGELVGIQMERSDRLIIALIGVLRSGGGYVPVDPAYPEQRRKYMLEKADVRCVLTEKEEWLEEDDEPLSGGSLPREPFPDEPKPESTASDIAAILYTSGSTGMPKGVVVEHRNIVSLVKGVTYLRFSPEDAVLASGSPSFDITFFEYWIALLNGGKVVICPESTVLDSAAVTEIIRKNGVSVAFFTTSLLNRLIETNIDMFRTMSVVHTGGEKLSVPHIIRLRNRYPQLSVLNCYGPTENTTYSTSYEIQELPHEDIPIGHPLSNRTVYILDKQLQLCPIGIPGELCVGGAGVARGYLYEEELTSRKFITDPVEGVGRIYRTGDLARWREDGLLEFIGRMDNQIKIRGYRVELDEIRNEMAKIPGIGSVTVLAIGSDDNKYLAAYYTGNEKIQDTKLKELLKQSVPAFMIPTYFVHVDEFPLTRNGKLDTARLPDPYLAGIERTDAFAPPANRFEEELAGIWQAVLHKDLISMYDNFFDIGGNSLKVINIHQQLELRYPGLVKVSDLFSRPTINSMADYLQERLNGDAVGTGTSQKIVF